MADPALTARSAVALAGAIRAGAVSAREVVEAHIAVLERWQSRTNAVAVARFDRARAEADAADARIGAAADGELLPPLLGVPCTIKEIFNVEGLPHTVGLVARKSVRATETAPVVQRLLDAGVVLLGLTNAMELAVWIETDNRVYGRTNNPYDVSRTAGGSSGGCGAAVGCGGVPFSLGTDTAGSVRIPAFFCGVFGHKPSFGLVPQTVSFPQITGETKRMVTFGPLARRAEDLMPLLRIIAGPDCRDAAVADVELGDPGGVRLDGLRVLISELAFLARISRELLDARERAADILRAAGARVERVSIPAMRHTFWPAIATVSDAGTTMVSETLHAGGVSPPTKRQLLRPGGPHTPVVRMMLASEPLFRLPSKRRMQLMIDRGREFATELADTIGDGVLLHPPLANTAPRHRRTYGRLLYPHPMAVFNLAGLPVTEVPVGLGARGLPLGVQVVAGHQRDHLTIAVAGHLEKRLGGWNPPTATN